MVGFNTDDDRLELLNQIDSICDRYEAAWKAGEEPKIEDYLAASSDALQKDLRPFLHEIELEYRRERSGTASLTQSSTVVSEAGLRATPSAAPAAPTPIFVDGALPCRFERFELQALLGQGATSAVYRAHDPRRDEIIAIKICHSSLFADRNARLRFMREAIGAEKLTHRRIARIWENGYSQGRPYLVMEFVAGGTLASALRNHAPQFDHLATAKLLSQVADAVAHAHSVGVIHRDIKPSNILLAETDSPEGSPADGSHFDVKLVDFGLAQVGESITQMTRSGEVLGTLSHMSPEVVAHGAHDADARSDIYGLGVVLYEMLTGRRPFRKPMPALLQQILLEPPPPPRRIDPSIPQELELICLKCLAKNPSERFQTASELKQELERWMEGKAIQTRPDSPAMALQKLVRRNRSRVLLGAAALIGVLLFIGVAGFLKLEQTRSQRALAAQAVDVLLQAQGPHLSDAIAKVQKIPFALAEAETRIDGGRLTPAQENRLRLASARNTPEDRSILKKFMMTDADAYEFSYLLTKLKSESLAADSLPQEESTRSDPVNFKFRRALIRASLAAPSDLAELDEGLAAGLIGLRTPELQSPWIPLAASRKAAVCGLLSRWRVSQLSAEEALAATYALVQFHQSDVAALVDLLEESEGTQHQIVCDALMGFEDAVASSLLAKIAAHDAPADAESDPQTVGEEVRLRQSRLLTALFRLRPQDFSQALKANLPSDPRLATYFMRTASDRRVEAAQLVERLHLETDVQSLRAILLALATYAPGVLAQNSALDAWLKKNYLDHPSAAIHAAIRFELRRQNKSDWIKSQDEALRGKMAPVREWYVTSEGIVMAILPAEMASRRLAVSMEEITVEQFKRFRPEFRPHFQAIANDPDHPVTGITAFDAMRFCIWLMQRDGRLESDQAIAFDEETGAATIDTTKPGYRLPTFAETKIASQAGAKTDRYFGENETPYFDAFVCGGGTAKMPNFVGRRIPNGAGLFDTLGNVAEWTLDDMQFLFQRDVGNRDDVRIIKPGDDFPRRTAGGAFSYDNGRCNSNMGDFRQAIGVDPSLGFRIICQPPPEMLKRGN